MFQLVGLHPCIDWETIHFGTDPAAATAERAELERYDEAREAFQRAVERTPGRTLAERGLELSAASGG